MGNKDNSLGQNRLRFVKDTYKVYDVNSSGNLQLVTDPTALNTLNENAKYALNYSEYGMLLLNSLRMRLISGCRTLLSGTQFQKI
jgi:hypothetical protein